MPDEKSTMYTIRTYNEKEISIRVIANACFFNSWNKTSLKNLHLELSNLLLPKSCNTIILVHKKTKKMIMVNLDSSINDRKYEMLINKAEPIRKHIIGSTFKEPFQKNLLTNCKYPSPTTKFNKEKTTK